MLSGDATYCSVCPAVAHLCVPPERNVVAFEANLQSFRLSVDSFGTSWKNFNHDRRWVGSPLGHGKGVLQSDQSGAEVKR